MANIIPFNYKFEALLTPESAEYKRKKFYLRYGGRASGKTYAFITGLVLRISSTEGNIICARENQRFIDESSHRGVCSMIERLGLARFFTITDSSIECKATGSKISFIGIGKEGYWALKDTDDLSVIFCDDAHNLSEKSLSAVCAKAAISENCEVWVAWNPLFNYKGSPPEKVEAVFDRFVKNYNKELMNLEEVNYQDNVFLPEGIKHCIEYDMKQDIEVFKAVWDFNHKEQ